MKHEVFSLVNIFVSICVHINSGRSRNLCACLVLFIFEGRMSAGFYNRKIVDGLAISH